MRKYSCNVHKIVNAHLQCVNNNYTQFDNKGMITYGVTVTQTRHPKSVADRQTDGWTGPTTKPTFRRGNQGDNLQGQAFVQYRPELNGHSKIHKTKILMTNSLNEGGKNCRMLPFEQSAILLTSIK